MKKISLILLVMMSLLNLQAQKRAFQISDLYRVQSVYGVTVSPEGNTLAYVHSRSDLKNHKSYSKKNGFWLEDKALYEKVINGNYF